jgi:exonuclease III
VEPSAAEATSEAASLDSAPPETVAVGVAGSADVAAGSVYGPRVVSVRFGLEGQAAEHSAEGRAITVEYEGCVVVALYVPNAGQELERLRYRVEAWNPSLQAYVKGLEESTGKPVVRQAGRGKTRCYSSLLNSRSACEAR